VNLFDTAEGYGNGFSEQILGKALQGIRQQVLIASKVSPDHFAQVDSASSMRAQPAQPGNGLDRSLPAPLGELGPSR